MAAGNGDRTLGRISRGARYVRGRARDSRHPLGYIKVSGTDVPIHEQLLAALPDKAQEVTSFAAAEGLVDFRVPL